MPGAFLENAKKVQFVLDEETIAKLKRLAQAKGASASAVMRELVKQAPEPKQ